ncbi:DUF397 domain-containing protein [Actinomadura harenae]|uniref:DUF397 domain-containing protein n=1 Tax=Actinomadura harenae TaxID=2483351 RepID=A0A3M2M556_9ACTN|nr:DUF397 domain-containing protein [Actinomadura harenae]RMI44706.1 DUF397 domain-containing protein [Actinomadura harenae]
MTEWRKSSHSSSTGGDCVEVARLAPNTVGIRDSKNPTGSAFALPRTAARDLLSRIKAGEDDLA